MQISKFKNYSLLSTLKHRINGGVILMTMAVLAMIIANSPLASAYHEIWEYPIVLQIGDFNLFSHHGEPLTVMQFINDALMAIFFFSVGLEIKREVMVGELSSIRKAMLPIIAALGGMIIPVLFYFLVAHEGPESAGLAIPMATDIAFSLGVLSMFGKRVPLSLKVFLTAFAVVDDIGGILVIAFFYTSHLSLHYLLLSAIVVAFLILGNRLGIMQRIYYIGLGIVMWYLFLQSGIHCTIAGVIIAFLIPAKPRWRVTHYVNRIRDSISKFPNYDEEEGEKIVLESAQINELKSIEAASNRVISPLQSLENNMHGLVNYFIMPLFAFANAGVELSGGMSSFGVITLAVFLGLTAGKFIGLYSFTFLAIKLKLVSMPKGMTWRNLAGVSLLGGIGFTVSLFIANLSFADHHVDLLNQAKIGVLLGTITAGVVGYIVLNIVLPKEDKKEAETDVETVQA